MNRAWIKIIQTLIEKCLRKLFAFRIVESVSASKTSLLMDRALKGSGWRNMSRTDQRDHGNR